LLLDSGAPSAKSKGPSWGTPVTQATRDAIAQALLVKASTAFNATAAARLASLAAALPTSESLKLPYLARRYDDLTALVQMEPLCDPSSSGWREAGCVPLRKQITGAKAALKSDLPALITAAITLMRAKGVDAALLDAAQTKLAQGDVKGAAILHDAALRGTEAT
jgi:hypothetical protein